MKKYQTLQKYAPELLDWYCGDSACVLGPVGGMMTNGGCRCISKENSVTDLRFKAQKLAIVARELLEELRQLRTDDSRIF